MKKLTILIAAIGLLASCSSTKVSSDQVSNANFSAFSTYTIKQIEDTNGKINPINTQRIENAIVNETEQRGLFQEKEAELEIVWGFGVDIQRSYSTNTNYYRTGGVGFRRGGYGMATSNSDTQEHATTNGILQIAVIDTETDEVIWVATAQDEFKGKSKKAEEKINAVIAKVFEEFPIDRSQS